jgi:hypothetical protein
MLRLAAGQHLVLARKFYGRLGGLRASRTEIYIPQLLRQAFLDLFDELDPGLGSEPMGPPEASIIFLP